VSEDITDIHEQEVVEDLSFSISEAYRDILIFVTPALLLLVGLYVGVWDFARLLKGLDQFVERPIFVIAVFLIGIPLHEVLHLLPWMILARVPLDDVRLGFQIKTLTPYAHVKTPIPARIYQLGTLFPGLALGILPYLWSIIAGDGLLMIFGMFFIYAAAGDFLVLWKIRHVHANTLLLDHPSRVGCIVMVGSSKEEVH
jgi:hypothetical protein